jgi:hypothetical protein
MTTVRSLHFPHQQIGIETGLMHEQAWKTAVALLHFEFHYGDLIRWMGGKYTNAHSDWSAVSAAIDVVRDIEPPDGYPRINFGCAFWACTNGVPLVCNHECSFESVRQQNLYNNHPGLHQVAHELQARFAKEEAQSFHIAFLWFVWQFIVGLHLAALVWVIWKMKGRLCVDPSSTISPDDDSAANDHAANDRNPKPGTMG